MFGICYNVYGLYLDPDDENALRQDLTENLDYVLIHSKIWDLLFSWYEGGPAFERKVYERSGSSSYVCFESTFMNPKYPMNSHNQCGIWCILQTKEKYICMHPRLVKLCYCDDETGEIDLTKTIVKGFPMDYKLNEVVKEVCFYIFGSLF